MEMQWFYKAILDSEELEIESLVKRLGSVDRQSKHTENVFGRALPLCATFTAHYEI